MVLFLSWKSEVQIYPKSKISCYSKLFDDLNSDQYYAYRICFAIMLGSVDANLEFLEVGGLNHSCWLTLGCRILQFYVAQEKPTSNLSTLAEFLIKACLPGWF